MYTWQYYGTQVVKLILNRNMTIGYVRESDYMEKAPYTNEKVEKMTEKQSPTPSSNTVREVAEISHEKLPPMPEKSAFMLHHNFYPKPKNRLKRC